MGLLEQIRTLDRLLHDHSARAELVADRETFLAALADEEDREAFRTLDTHRLAAVAGDLKAKIHSRWYAERFPLSLQAAEWLLGIEPVEVVARVMAHPAFGQRQGEDTTGVSFFLALLDAATADPRAPWMADLLAYEYLTRCGLPRRARGEPVDLELEQALLPGGALTQIHGALLAAPCTVLTFDWPAGELAEHLATGGTLPVELDPEPTRLMFFLGETRADELGDVYPLHELVLACAEADSRKALLAAFDEPERDLAEEALAFLASEGFVRA